jgi:hypothetical protein
MSGSPELSGHGRTGSEVRDPSRPLDLIACDDCGRNFATLDGPGMLAVIKGPCPDCGGRFELVSDRAPAPRSR